MSKNPTDEIFEAWKSRQNKKDAIAEVTEEFFNKYNFVPQALFFANEVFQTGFPAEHFMKDTRRLSEAARKLVKQFNIHTVTLTSEMWITSLQPKTKEEADEIIKNYDKLKKTGALPKKEEGALIQIWTRFSTITRTYKIIRTYQGAKLVLDMDTERHIDDEPANVNLINPFKNL